MSIAVDLAVASPTIPPAALYGYNRWHHRRRTSTWATVAEHIRELEASTGIGKSDLEVIAEIQEQLDPAQARERDEIYRAARNSGLGPAQDDTSWRAVIYRRGG